MVAHPGQILQPHSLLPLRQRGGHLQAKVEKHLFQQTFKELNELKVRRKGISHLWKSRSKRPAFFTGESSSKDSDLTGMQAARCIKARTDVGHRKVEPGII